MRAEQAYNSEITLEHTCVGIGILKWESLMEGAVKADGRKIRAMIRKQLPNLFEELCLDFYNPYEPQCVRTNTHLIYISSSIEYFLKLS